MADMAENAPDVMFAVPAAKVEGHQETNKMISKSRQANPSPRCGAFPASHLRPETANGWTADIKMLRDPAWGLARASLLAPAVIRPGRAWFAAEFHADLPRSRATAMLHRMSFRVFRAI
jgi:hypothetical protein